MKGTHKCSVQVYPRFKCIRLIGINYQDEKVTISKG